MAKNININKYIVPTGLYWYGSDDSTAINSALNSVTPIKAVTGGAALNPVQ